LPGAPPSAIHIVTIDREIVTKGSRETERYTYAALGSTADVHPNGRSTRPSAEIGETTMTTRWWRTALAGAILTTAPALPATAVSAAEPVPAPTAAPGATTVPLDSFAFAPTGAGRVLPDSAPQERRAPLVLWSTGAASTTVDLATPANRLRIRARADVCEGLPNMVVAVDGVDVLDTDVSTTWSNSTFVATGSWDAGEHRVAVRYTNEHRTATCDRNLKVGEVTFAARPIMGTFTRLRGTDFTVPQGVGGTFRYGLLGEPAFGLWSNGGATATAVTQGANSLLVGARGEDCLGRPPRMHVFVDGEKVIDARVRTRLDDRGNEVTGTYGTLRNFGSGTRQVEVRFVNDRITDTCDRNLKVEHVTFIGAA
jgi:hypothetical protein